MEALPGGDPPGVVLSENPRPEHPRPSMTFKQQADLIEYFHGRIALTDGQLVVTATIEDRGFLDDLWLTAQRLRRMVGFDDEIRRLVTGK